MDDINHMLAVLRGQLADAEADLAEKKEARRAIREVKDIIDADYEYSNEQVREAQSKITIIERIIDKILSDTGV